MEYILGINCSGFHSSVCLLHGSTVVAAICEERLSRVKHDRTFPHRAIAYCCAEAGIPFSKISHAFIGWHPRHYLRMSDDSLHEARQNRGKFSYLALNELAGHFSEELVGVEQQLRSENDQLTIHFVDHYQAHLANAFYPSGYKQTDFLALDGFGELTTGMCGHIDDSGADIFIQYPFPHSLGAFYSAFTEYMGFKPKGDEWKVMALSALGRPEPFYDRIRPMVRLDGLRFELDLSYFEHFLFFKPKYYADKLIELLGPPFPPGAEPTQRECDMVAAVQVVVEEITLGLLDALHERTGCDSLVLNGGFFLNSVCNGRVFRNSPYANVYIGGSPDDTGVSVGAAMFGAHHVLGGERPTPATPHLYYGRPYSNEEIEYELKRKKIRHTRVDNPAVTGARIIHEGRLLGWFQGGSEFGQRALGNRSILADPSRPEMKAYINAAVKYREGFRPFAPSVLEECQYDVLGIPPGRNSFFMETVFPILPEWRGRIPAVVHADGSARPQTVTKKSNPLFYALIEEFRRLTGIPLVLNTSFNINGMPMVETPSDALMCFFNCGLDALILGNFLVEK